MLFCEGATLKYPDKGAKKSCLGAYCCNEECGYKSCTLYAVLEDYYQRLYAGEKIEHIAKQRTPGKKTGRPSKFNGG
jgi:hypothetical protein